MRARTTDRAVRAVLFDLDGTLLDTVDDLMASANHALALEGLPPADASEMKSHVSGGARTMIGYWLVKTLEQRPTLAYPAVNTVLEENREIFERVVNRMMTYYEQNPADHTRYFEGMESVLDHLEGRGIPWGIVTNKRSRYTQPLTEALEIHLRTPCIVSGDTTAESKPHPLPLIEASGRLGIDPAYCVYIGDAARDIEAGRRAGMMTLAALYGYINANEDIEGWGADDALEVPTDLIPWMDQQAG